MPKNIRNPNLEPEYERLVARSSPNQFSLEAQYLPAFFGAQKAKHYAKNESLLKKNAN